MILQDGWVAQKLCESHFHFDIYPDESDPFRQKAVVDLPYFIFGAAYWLNPIPRTVKARACKQGYGTFRVK